MKKIAITGTNGLVGSRLVELISDEYEIIPVSHANADITNRDQTHAFIKSLPFDMFLHLAAYTNVDGAETEPETANLINETGTKNVFEAVQEQKKPFILFSTDFVFDGVNPPFTEESRPKAISEYGQSKLNGEQVVGNNGMIVRISYPYRALFEKKKDFVRTIKWLLEEKRQITMIQDSLITPTFIDNIALGLKQLLKNYSPEIFHLVGSSSLSPYEAGKAMAKTFELDENLIQPVDYATYFKGKAQRPQFSKIISTKNIGYTMKTFEEGLREMKQQLAS